MVTIAEIWNRIHNWLSKKAPALNETFRDGASDEEIQKLEEAVETNLPEDFKASYRIHNGHSAGTIFHDHFFLSIGDIISEWSLKKKILEESKFNAPYENEPKDATLKIQYKWWDPKWIPFTNNGCGDSIMIDMAPAEAGSMGQVFEWIHDDDCFNWYATSFKEYLQNFAEDLEAGKYKICIDDNEKNLERIE